MTTPAIRLNAPGDLVSSLPALLSFHPQQSLVVIAFGPGSTRVGPVLRADLPPGAVEMAAGQMLAMLPAEYRDHAVLVTVNATDRDDAAPDVSLVLTAAGVRVTASVHTTGTRPGDRWRCLDPGYADTGTVPAPPAELTARLAWHGQATTRLCLTPGYYRPLATRIEQLRADGVDPAALDEVGREIGIRERFRAEYGYTGYVLRPR